jgi:hypothetical protein
VLLRRLTLPAIMKTIVSLTMLIEQARNDPAKLAMARLAGCMYRVKIDSKGRAVITEDGARIALKRARAWIGA